MRLVRVMACMQVCDVQHDGFQLRGRVVFGLKEPHLHVMCVVVDDEQAVAEAMWGGDIHWTPKVRAHVEKGTG
jgi:glutaredoxin 2